MFGRFKSGLKNALIAGTLVLLPLVVTVWLFVTLVQVADGVIDLMPAWAHPETYAGFPLPGLGLIITFAIVTGVGLTTRAYAGRRIVSLYEAILQRVPVLNGVYQGLKQLVETLFGSTGRHFQQVVLVEYPRPGIHCVAFLSNDRSFIRSDAGVDLDLVSVFLPTTPNPTSGFFLLVPRSEVKVLDMGIDDAFKLIMSAGIVVPEGHRVAASLK